MIISSTRSKVYDIDESILDEYIEFITTNGIETNFYEFIQYLYDAYELEDYLIEDDSEWASVEGNSNVNEEFKNIIENYLSND